MVPSVKRVKVAHYNKTFAIIIDPKDDTKFGQSIWVCTRI